MSQDAELESWRRQWQGAAAPPADAVVQLRQRVLRETRWLKWSLIGPILVTLGVGGGMTLRALRTQQPLDVLFAVETWIFIVVTWIGALWLARGTWRPLADTTAAFVAVSIRRRKANARAAIFALCLYVAQLVFVVLALAAELPGGVARILTSSFMVVVGWIGIPAGLALIYWFHRRRRAELERLRELERQLRTD
ncbi:MAG TPA: hypothetical protein VM692_09450 [Gammaproteobacteria bacterium]|nr:hypothetical protein [Gammaproteobacteria bacterium]